MCFDNRNVWKQLGNRAMQIFLLQLLSCDQWKGLGSSAIKVDQLLTASLKLPT